MPDMFPHTSPPISRPTGGFRGSSTTVSTQLDTGKTDYALLALWNKTRIFKAVSVFCETVILHWIVPDCAETIAFYAMVWYNREAYNT